MNAGSSIGSHDDEVGLTFAHLDSGHRDGAEVAEGCEPRTFRCQNPAERIPICAGTQVEAVGGARLERVREGQQQRCRRAWEFQKSTRENRTGLYFVLFVTVTCI